MFIYTMNMTKIISISDDAYKELSKIKLEKESFSKVILRCTKKNRKPLMDFFGIWTDKEDLSRIHEELKEERRKFKTRDFEFD